MVRLAVPATSGTAVLAYQPTHSPTRKRAIHAACCVAPTGIRNCLPRASTVLHARALSCRCWFLSHQQSHRATVAPVFLLASSTFTQDGYAAKNCQPYARIIRSPVKGGANHPSIHHTDGPSTTQSALRVNQTRPRGFLCAHCLLLQAMGSGVGAVFPSCHQKSMSLCGGVPRSKFSSGHLTHGCGLLLPTRERADSINALACALS